MRILLATSLLFSVVLETGGDPSQMGDNSHPKYPTLKEAEWGISSELLWDTRPRPFKSLSIVPANIVELSGRLISSLAEERPRNVREGVLVLYVTIPYRDRPNFGVFLGLDIVDEKGGRQRYMYSFEESEIDFARRVLNASRVTNPTLNRPALPGARQPDTQPKGGDPVKEQPTIQKSKDQPR